MGIAIGFPVRGDRLPRTGHDGSYQVLPANGNGPARMALRRASFSRSRFKVQHDADCPGKKIGIYWNNKGGDNGCADTRARQENGKGQNESQKEEFQHIAQLPPPMLFLTPYRPSEALKEIVPGRSRTCQAFRPDGMRTGLTRLIVS